MLEAEAGSSPPPSAGLVVEIPGGNAEDARRIEQMADNATKATATREAAADDALWYGLQEVVDAASLRASRHRSKAAKARLESRVAKLTRLRALDLQLREQEQSMRRTHIAVLTERNMYLSKLDALAAYARERTRSRSGARSGGSSPPSGGGDGGGSGGDDGGDGRSDKPPSRGSGGGDLLRAVMSVLEQLQEGEGGPVFPPFRYRSPAGGSPFGSPPSGRSPAGSPLASPSVRRDALGDTDAGEGEGEGEFFSPDH